MAIASGTWAPISEVGLNQPIATNSTTQHYSIGKRVRCRDVSTTTNYGEAEFVYLKGVASTAVGDLVVFEGNGTTIRASARGEGPVAVAMSACVASEYGWYQLTGLAVVTSGTVADNAQLYLTGTAGTVDDAHVAGDQIFGMRSDSASDTGLVKATMNHPHVADHDDSA
jgi:hypothetical protein